ncbi:YjgP/YjgQ family permease [bacterium]|jgi:lipopolysaccharide export system permease protein|nr:YjgP/YjgQ family permease [bacterium]
MGILQRHILASVAAACAAAVGLFGFVLIAGQALRDLLGYVVAGQLEAGTAARLLGLLVPFVAVYALPIGLLTGVLLVLGRMASQQEITAMRAAGLSLRYIARPVWVIAWVGVVLSLALNFEIMPRAQTEYRVTLLEAVRQNPLNFIVPKTFVRDFDGFVVYVSERKGSELKDFWLWKLDAQKRVTGLVRARRATIALREADDRLVLTLFEASAETRARPNPEDFSKPQPIGNSDSLTVELPLDGVFNQMQAGQKIMFMTFDQLRARREQLEAKGATATQSERRDLTRIAVTLSSRAAGSFAVLAFAVIAVPLGIKVSRKETSANLGIAVALVLGYYFLDALARMLERSPELHPEIWVWLPPLLYAGVGGWLFQRVDRA